MSGGNGASGDDSREGSPERTSRDTTTRNKENRADKKIRLRRARSTSIAQHITEQEKKKRDAQPDKPIHRPQDSLFSWSSGFDQFEGFANWAALILVIGGSRLCLENIIKYGLLVNPTSIIKLVASGFDIESSPNTLKFLLACHVHHIFVYILERLLAKGIVSSALGVRIHVAHLCLIVMIPFVGIGMWHSAFSLLGRLLICFTYTVTFLKMWSYAQVNYWCREDRRFQKKLTRRMSTTFKKIQELPNGMDDSGEGLVELSVVEYPENLTISDLYYFLVVPTLCYELNFPRSKRIRKSFLLRRIIEFVLLFNLALAMFQQYLIPSVKNSFQEFSDMDYLRCAERLLKLAIPNHFIWLIAFYCFFHSYLNTLGETLRFADRNFYQDWWNAKDVGTFWRLWNMPVHRWAVRHVFVPLLKHNYSRETAALAVFFISAFFHEYLVSIPLHMHFKVGVFLGMIVQLPLVYISSFIRRVLGYRMGNAVMWLSIILGQPLGILVYYHDYVVENYTVADL